MGYEAVARGFQQGVDMYNAPEKARQDIAQEQSKTQLLSEQVQQQKMKTREEADSYATKMSTRSAMAKAQQDNIALDMSDMDNQAKVLQDAIQGSDNVESKQTFIEQLHTLQVRQTEVKTKAAKSLVESAEADSILVNNAMLDTTLGAGQLKSSKNPQIANLGKVLSNEIPVPLQYTGGKPMSYSQLSPEQKSNFDSQIRQSFPGSKVERVMHDVATEEQRALQEKRLKEQAAETERLRTTNAALKRDKIKTVNNNLAIKAQLTSLENTYKSEQGELLAYIKEVEKNSPEIENPAYSWRTMGVPKHIPNPLIETLKEQKRAVRTKYLEDVQKTYSKALTPEAAAVVGTKVYTRPKDFTDEEWKQYQVDMGATQ